jgi:hypothetical protein
VNVCVLQPLVFSCRRRHVSPPSHRLSACLPAAVTARPPAPCQNSEAPTAHTSTLLLGCHGLPAAHRRRHALTLLVRGCKSFPSPSKCRQRSHSHRLRHLNILAPCPYPVTRMALAVAFRGTRPRALHWALFARAKSHHQVMSPPNTSYSAYTAASDSYTVSP